MFCKNCGNEISDGAAFCGKCGTSMSGNTNVQPVIVNESQIKGKNKGICIVVLVLGIILVALVIAIIVSTVSKGDKVKDTIANHEVDSTGEEKNTDSKKQKKKLLEKMQGDWEASLTGGFYGSHHYVPHWDVFIDSEFIYVTDGATFNHDINDVEYIEEGGVGYIVFEDIVWHKETLSSVEIVEGEERMPIRLFFIEDDTKIAFEINPDETEWKRIAEYRRTGTKEEEVSETLVLTGDDYYIDTGIGNMNVITDVVMIQYSLNEFDEVIKNQYGGDAGRALQDLFEEQFGAIDEETEVYLDTIGKYYVKAISYYETNGCYEDSVMIKLAHELLGE